MSEHAEASAARPALTDEDRRFALQYARQCLTAYLEREVQPDAALHSPGLMEPRASFVTLRNRRSFELRGCRGEIRARRPLIESVARMTISSAIDDPRFPSVERIELPELIIQISALTPFHPIRPEDVELGRHGLMIQLGSRSGLLLPKVPALYDIRTPRAFLEAVCQKAALPDSAWCDPEAQLLGFESDDWGESPTDSP